MEGLRVGWKASTREFHQSLPYLLNKGFGLFAQSIKMMILNYFEQQFRIYTSVYTL